MRPVPGNAFSRSLPGTWIKVCQTEFGRPCCQHAHRTDEDLEAWRWAAAPRCHSSWYAAGPGTKITLSVSGGACALRTVSGWNGSSIPLPTLALYSVTHSNIQRLTASGKLLSQQDTSTRGHKVTPTLLAVPPKCITSTRVLAMDHVAASAVLSTSLKTTEVTFQEPEPAVITD